MEACQHRTGVRMKRALITGTSGQCGSFLAKSLLNKGYQVSGTVRRVSSPTNLWRLAELQILDRVHLIPADMTDAGSLLNAIRLCHPHEIYNLAAQSFVHASFQMPQATTDVDALGLVRLLDAIRSINPDIRVYQASSSEIYGAAGEHLLLDENSPKIPNSPYATAKLYAFHTARLYREAYGMFVVNGILFNNDSSLRGQEFVSRRISNYVGRLAVGLAKEKLALGNLNAIRDFGFAPSYMDVAWRMLQQDKPDDYVVATGIGHSVQDFAKAAFAHIGEDWQRHVEISDAQKRPLDVPRLVGCAEKARLKLDWQSQVSFGELVTIMVEADIQRWQRYKRGENFPWDVIV